MKLVRKVSVLLLLVAALAYSSETSRADYECELAAAHNRESCLYACDNYYPWWSGCPNYCQSNYEQELANCNSR